MTEIWKDIKGYEGLYQVSNTGKVRSLDHETLIERKRGKPYILKKRGRELTPIQLNHGYVGVMLYGNGGHPTRCFRTYSIHRLVADAFIPNPKSLPEVNHKDEDKANNVAENLEWVTHKENSNYGTRAERIAAAHRADANKKRRKIAQYSRSGDLVKIFPSIAEVRRCGYNGGNAYRCAKGSNNYSHSQGYIWRFIDD